MNDLPRRVEEAIRQHGLLKRGQSVLVAVSGGLDSMVLLRVLQELSRRHGWSLTVAHLNHQLRGRSSDADERLVRRQARRFGLPFVGRRATVAAFARTRRLSLEMAARAVRHDFLARAAAQRNIRIVALAHHADDQLELFFLRLLRGSGGEGLTGMKWRNASPSDLRIRLIRPLLGEHKAALRAYARAAGVQFREDASNASLEIQRNRIRHELLPLLRRRYQPALERTVLRTMDITGAEAELATHLAAQWLSARRRIPFAELPRAVQRRCVQLQLLEHQLRADFELVERLRTQPGRKITLSATQTVGLDPMGDLLITKTKVSRLPVGTNQRRRLELRGPAGQSEFGGLSLCWHINSRSPVKIPPPRPGREYFDADKVGRRVILRHWRPGDRFHPSGMPAPVKLQDLFTNLKVPPEQRHKLVVLTTAHGELVWVEKLRIAERFKLSSTTNRRLRWQWKSLGIQRLRA